MNRNGNLSLEKEKEQRLLRGVSRSFALTIPQLPQELRGAVTNAYLLCRIADTIEDEEALTIDRKCFFLHQFEDVLNGKASAEQFAEALYPLLSCGTLPSEKELIRNAPQVIHTTFGFSRGQQAALKRCATIMSKGMREFQQIKNPRGLKDIEQLNRYCYYVAGVVGEMLTDLFCMYSHEIAENRDRLFGLALSFGQGLQMTNILKDLWDDKARGACWLPQDVFEKTGFNLAFLSQDSYEPAFGEGLYVLTAIACERLRNALTYTLIIPPHEKGIRRFCLWAIGMALLTLRNIYRKPDYKSGKEVKISRRSAKAVILLSNMALGSNWLLKTLFGLNGRLIPSCGQGDLGKDSMQKEPN